MEWPKTNTPPESFLHEFSGATTEKSIQKINYFILVDLIFFAIYSIVMDITATNIKMFYNQRFSLKADENLYEIYFRIRALEGSNPRN